MPGWPGSGQRRPGHGWPSIRTASGYAYGNPPEGLVLCRVADGAELMRLPGGNGPLPIRRLCFSPNGELLAAT